jgi:tRNA pseudouridine55 synthase
MNGLLLINKPEGLTSFEVVKKVREILKAKKVGHFGSLDPMATGLLIIALGKATRLFSFYLDLNKTYRGKIRLGLSTTTYDREGEPTTEEKEVKIREEEIKKALREFEGEQEQLPPPYSARKYKGKSLYQYARLGERPILKPKKVKIYYIKLLNYIPPFLEFELECSSGTYIRSLANSLGEYLGVGAYLFSLTRIKIGDFDLNQSLLLEEVKKLSEENKIYEKIIPLETLLPQFPKVILEEKGAKLALNGNIVPSNSVLKIIGPREEIFRLFNVEGRFLALARRAKMKRGFQPFVVFKLEEERQL